MRDEKRKVSSIPGVSCSPYRPVCPTPHRATPKQYAMVTKLPG